MSGRSQGRIPLFLQVLTELRRPGSSSGLTKARVRAWFTARKPGMARKGPDRWDVRTARLKVIAGPISILNDF